VSNENIGLNKFLVADAAMIVLNRRLSPNVVTTGAPQRNFTDPQPSSPWLGQNYPNPFNPVTVISYQLAVSSIVKITIYDILGRDVATLVNEEKKPGHYSIRWDASSVGSGVYYYCLRVGEHAETRKMILLK
jgi:hypothetical protein